MSKNGNPFCNNYYILPIDVNALASQNVVITTFCNVTTFWVATVPVLAPTRAIFTVLPMERTPSFAQWTSKLQPKDVNGHYAVSLNRDND